jgi:elongation factor 3
MWDTKKQVKEQALEAMKAMTAAIDNLDLKPFIPALIEAITHPEQVPDCVYALAGTTFVQTVTASALSITVPVLDRGFKERKTAIRRKCAVIAENMAKLVEDPADVAPFLPLLHPALAKGEDEIADPECRGRFKRARETLERVSGKGKPFVPLEASALAALVAEGAGIAKDGAAARFAGAVGASLANTACEFTPAAWSAALGAALAPACGEATPAADLAEKGVRTALVEAVTKLGHRAKSNKAALEDDGEDEAVPDLCNLQFSLAYGSNILLNNSRLHLKKGFKYGIIANKSAGKTTMMRAISNGQVEGFPNPQDVRTVFIENDIQGDQMTMNVVEFVMDTVAAGIGLEDIVVTEEEVREMLKEIGLTQVMIDGPITSLSGGWKMKLALGRATLQKADIMLMDEPTNHLDVLNVQWVVDYINSLPTVTCMMVSHDTKFLDKTITHVIHFEDLKLHTYKGNISRFVELFPKAKSYFELGETDLVFRFPKPGNLAGVKNKGRSILQMKNVNFTYPGAAKPQLTGVTVCASMASRVAIVGANGAGKSTMIKLLTGEMKPSKGQVKKHPNCRFAYVAQHAFHHIEKHLEKSPNEYIRWRYETGEDKEAKAKATAVITPEEQKKMNKPIEVTWKDEEGKSCKEKRVVEKVISRRKEKKEYMYEVVWKNKSMDLNMWYRREFLVKSGFEKLLKALDSRIAAQDSMLARPLTARNVEQHLSDVGLEVEYSTHSRIKDLSGGQKVKVVLGACTWACPHLIILDEPTNYLDRDSLGALANAIKEFEGGVVLITHNKEFADATTKVTWVVANNKCTVHGDPEWEKYAAEQHFVQDDADEMLDAAGNTVKIVKIPKLDEMTKKEVKKFKKIIRNKVKNGEPLDEHEKDWADEWDINFGGD